MVNTLHGLRVTSLICSRFPVEAVYKYLLPVHTLPHRQRVNTCNSSAILFALLRYDNV